MAYVRGAKRHPMFALTITPEEEARIEEEITVRRRPRSPAEVESRRQKGIASAALSGGARCGTCEGELPPYPGCGPVRKFCSEPCRRAARKVGRRVNPESVTA